MSDTNGSGAGGVVLGLAIGVTLGAAVALLYAPRSGRNSRRWLTGKGRTLQGEVRGALDSGKDYVRDQKSALSAALEGGRLAMREERAEQAVPD